MEKVTITFLGTGDSIPTKKRNHTSILLQYKNETCMFDCGEGTQRQLKFARISAAKITKIFITHWHGDHTLGLAGLFQTLSMSAPQKKVQLYGPRGTKHKIELLHQIYNSYAVKVDVQEIEPGTIIDTDEYAVEAFALNHGIPALAYTFTIKDKRRLNKGKLKKLKVPSSPLLKELAAGKNIKVNNKTIKATEVSYIEKGKKIAIVLDTALTPSIEKAAKNADLLIIESTFSKLDEQIAADHRHLTATQAAQIAKKASVKKLMLTHISQRYDAQLDTIEKEAQKLFKQTMLAKELSTIAI